MGQGISRTSVIEEVGKNEQEEVRVILKTKPKNADYYFDKKKRFTKISRKLYRDYERGYIYGYYEKENPVDLEKEF